MFPQQPTKRKIKFKVYKHRCFEIIRNADNSDTIAENCGRQSGKHPPISERKKKIIQLQS
jgi:hypothetical protein